MKLGFLIGSQCMKLFKLVAPEPEQCNPSEVSGDSHFII